MAQFLNSHIPAKEKLFEEFLAQRKWQRYRQSLINDILVKKKARTGTTIHHIPYSIRINEDLDFDYFKGKHGRQSF